MNYINIIIVATWSIAFGFWMDSGAAAAFAFLTPTVIILVWRGR